MKKTLLLLLLVFGVKSSFAECAMSGMSFFPETKEISLNSMFIIQGYDFSQKTSEKVYWITTAKKSIGNLNPDLSLEFEKTEVIPYGCGPSVNAIFKIKNKPESEIWYKTEVVETATNKKNVYYLKEWDGKLNVGHGMCAGANIAYATYLFNSKNKKFEYSEVFSDYNIEYDPDKNRISSFMKSGVDNYYYRFKNLKENRKDVDFIENIHHSADTIFYTKIIDEKS